MEMDNLTLSMLVSARNVNAKARTLVLAIIEEIHIKGIEIGGKNKVV